MHKNNVYIDILRYVYRCTLSGHSLPDDLLAVFVLRIDSLCSMENLAVDFNGVIVTLPTF